MRACLLFLLLLVSPLCSRSQTFVPYPSDSAYWRYGDWTASQSSQAEPPAYIWGIYMVGDTVINSSTWKKMYQEGYGFIGAIKEINTSVYTYSFDWNDSMRVFDYSLNIGDSLVRDYPPAVSAPDKDTIIIHDIDTLFIGSIMHREWKMHYPNYPSYSMSVIDGIGTGHTRSTITTAATELLCFFTGGQIYYTPQGPWSPFNCYTGDEENIPEEFSIIYDPSAGNINITSDEQLTYCRIFNSTGQLIVSVKHPHSQVSLMGLSHGFYIVHLEFQNGKSGYQKIIK